MLNHYSTAELVQICNWMSVGGGLGFFVFVMLAGFGGHPNGEELLLTIGGGSGFAMILCSAVITWRKTA